jgi:hypothetical protein
MQFFSNLYKSARISHFIKSYLTKTVFHDTSVYNKNVIVTLTTTPKRINRIWPTLNSILLQSERPEKIYLWIPRLYKRFPQHAEIQLPDFIKHNPSVHVQFIDTDYGPATKLLPCLQLSLDPNTKIIVIDDDRLYPPHFIKDLLTYEKLDPNAALGIAGAVVLGKMRQEYRSTNKLAMADVLLGYQGYLVKPKFFSNAVFEYPENLPEAFFEDDVWFSGHLQKRGIRRVLIPSMPATQSRLTRNKQSGGLCMHENKDKRNFMRVFHYFNSTTL